MCSMWEKLAFMAISKENLKCRLLNNLIYSNRLKILFKKYLIFILLYFCRIVYVHEKFFIKRTSSTTKKSPVVIAQSKTYPVSTYLLIISDRKFIILIIIK